MQSDVRQKELPGVVGQFPLLAAGQRRDLALDQIVKVDIKTSHPRSCFLCGWL